MEEPKKKYILLNDRVGSTLERNLAAWSLGHSMKATPTQVLRGELLEALPEAEQPSDFQRIALFAIERKSLRLECPTAEVTRLSDEEANLLLSISSLGERYATFIDRKRLDFGRRLSPENQVFVSVKRDDLPGVVRYKGELPSCPGTMFGVELIENPGQGNCDGTFRNKRYFTCPPDSGVFVGLDKLTPREVADSKSSERGENAQVNFKSRLEEKAKSRQQFGVFFNPAILAPRRILDSKSSKRGENAEANFKSRLDKKGKSHGESPQEGINQVLGIKQRVVTFIEDCPARGTVRYIGKEEDGSGNMRTIVGLEMDEKCGSGTGKRNGRQFFVCRNDFAAFVDARNLVREEDFDGDHEDTTCTGKKTQDKQEAVHKEIRKVGAIKLREDDQQEENYRRQLREMEQQLREKDKQEENSQRQLRKMEQQLRENDKQEENLQRQLREMEQQLREKDKQEEGDLQRQLSEMEQQLREKDEQGENLQRELREMTEQLISLQGQCKEKEQENSDLERQLRDRDQNLVEVNKTLSETQGKLKECKCQEKRDWIIPREDILITNQSLGSGGWGYVHEGKYCGCTVAVKRLYEKDLISPYNRGKFEREMDIASRCRHPCLLQFIGATNDEESPLFVTELMELSLRQLLKKRPLSDREVVTISLDVARALSYLHNKKPSPILHRDVSSANVLLWRRDKQWRAKVSDYGTANFLQDTMTANPGAMIYSAPEACAPTQTVKIDVYSFGVLLCEMCIRELPELDRRDNQVCMVKIPVIQALIRRCLQSAAEDRPNMEEVIEELEQPN